jgi:hypothetical protein
LQFFFFPKEMSIQLTDYIIEDRFEPLRPYLVGIMTEDLVNGLVSVEDVLDATEAKHRLLMTVFIKKYLIPLGRPDSSSSKSTSETAQVLSNGHLDLKGRIASKDLQRTSWWSPVNAIPKLPEVAENPSAVISIDLSNNFLSNKDLEDVAAMLEELSSCRTVNLSNNRLKTGAGTEILTRILAMHDGMKVILCGNALASVDGEQFLSDLSDTELEKLIWIPRHWFGALGWHNAISSNKWDIVYRTHDSFYHKI